MTKYKLLYMYMCARALTALNNNVIRNNLHIITATCYSRIYYIPVILNRGAAK